MHKDFSKALEKAEQDVILEAYEYANYNQAKTARSLNISRNTLRKKLNAYLGTHEVSITKKVLVPKRGV